VLGLHWREYCRGLWKDKDREQRISALSSDWFGSASELDYELLLAKDLGYLNQFDYARIARELAQIRKMLSSLLRKCMSNVKAKC